jgi:hypothetical protein
MREIALGALSMISGTRNRSLRTIIKYKASNNTMTSVVLSFTFTGVETGVSQTAQITQLEDERIKRLIQHLTHSWAQ